MSAKNILLLLSFSVVSAGMVSQNESVFQTWKSSDPHYWQNKPTEPGYWQQDVYYQIAASIDEETDKVTGNLRLTYSNNSPDTLKRLFFHLYQNAFQPGAYYDNLQDANKRAVRYGNYEKQKLGTIVSNVKIDNLPAEPIIDNTIMSIPLSKPLKPGDNVVVEMNFNTWFDDGGNTRRRMKVFDSWGRRHYDGVHWYPRISVYDRKFGWTTDQHLDKEFYGEFGIYEVSLTFPADYVVEATGELQNRGEVLPEALREKLDISNFANKPWNEYPSVISPETAGDRATKTWKFTAKNVHDFAFTADPNYRIGEEEITLPNGHKVQCIALVQEPHAAGWRTTAALNADIIQFYSEYVGPYGYPKMVVADARDGMEYPMLTLCGGFHPGYLDLIAHEVGHNWFFGMVGTNETYRAAMDEGFTEFIDTKFLEATEGPFMRYSLQHNKKYEQRYKKPISVRDMEIYLGYIARAASGADAALNTHSSDFGGTLRHGGGYGMVYYKMAAMLYNLEYVLGESLFRQALQDYFRTWSYRHPYFEDFKASVRKTTKADLNWFFDQWWDTEKIIDYAIKGVKKTGNTSVDGTETYDIHLTRKGGMQMPIDLAVVTENDTFNYYIPNTWFEKETDATVLPRWYGWGKLQEDYHATITVNSLQSGKIKNIIIDPSERLADIYMADNRWKDNTDFHFDHRVINYPDWRKYDLAWGPTLWYNYLHGVKAGLHLQGDYLNRKHKFELDIWVNTMQLAAGQFNESIPTISFGSDPINFAAGYSTYLDRISRDLEIGGNAGWLDGMASGSAHLSYAFSDALQARVFIKSFIRPRMQDTLFPLYQEEWRSGLWNNSIGGQLTKSYNAFKSRGTLSATARASFIASDYSYAYLEGEWINQRPLLKMPLRTRLFGRIGSGQPGVAALWLAGANPEMLYENKWTRSGLYDPATYASLQQETGHFQQGGGLNLRGYNNYLVAEKDSLVYPAFKGNSGLAVNGEVDIDDLIRFRPRLLRNFHLDIYGFADAGIISYRTFQGNEWAAPRMDAGIGTALTIKRFGRFEEWKPFTIRADFPIYLSHVPFTESGNIQFRWLIGIGRTF